LVFSGPPRAPHEDMSARLFVADYADDGLGFFEGGVGAADEVDFEGVGGESDLPGQSAEKGAGDRFEFVELGEGTEFAALKECGEGVFVEVRKEGAEDGLGCGVDVDFSVRPNGDEARETVVLAV